jgi:threonine dehydratase
MMGGLRCGEVSPLAFEAALPLVSAYVGIGDDWAARAMRTLARPSGTDPRIVAGPSGAAALGGLLAALEDPAAMNVRRVLRLGPASTVVLIATEGMTDPPLWHRIVGGD